MIDNSLKLSTDKAKRKFFPHFLPVLSPEADSSLILACLDFELPTFYVLFHNSVQLLISISTKKLGSIASIWNNTHLLRERTGAHAQIIFMCEPELIFVDKSERRKKNQNDDFENLEAVRGFKKNTEI